jgi:hypothetical protein
VATIIAAVIILLVFCAAALVVSFVFAARLTGASDVASPAIARG